MLKRWKHFFFPPVLADDDQSATGYMLNIILLSIIAILVVSSILIYLLRMPANPITMALVGVTIIANIWMLRAVRRGRVNLVGSLLPLEPMMMWIGSVISVGTTRAPVMGILFLPVIMSGLLGTVRTVILYSGLTLVAMAGLFVAEANGLIRPTQPLTAGLLQAVTYGIIFVITAILLVLVNYSIRLALQRARKNESALAERNQELQALSASLETQVQERTLNAVQARQEAEVARLAIEQQAWVTAGQLRLIEAMSGEQSVAHLAQNVVNQVCRYLDIPAAVLYVCERGGEDHSVALHPAAGYAVAIEEAHSYQAGQGVIGQVLIDKRSTLLTGASPSDLRIHSTLGAAAPRQVLIQPLLDGEQVIGVLELLLLRSLLPHEEQYLRMVNSPSAVALRTALARQQINALRADKPGRANDPQAEDASDPEEQAQ